mgnify:CR=1 FL=1
MAGRVLRFFSSRECCLISVNHPTLTNCMDAPLAYNKLMIFVETPMFTKLVTELLTDDNYKDLQVLLADSPDTGVLIKGTGGLRKIRVASKGHGKRGGSRVIYYHFVSASQIGMLLVYPKNETEELSDEQRSALRRIVENWRTIL